MPDAPDYWPVRSIDGKGALDVFYTDYNDVNLYVEDEDQENLYEEIFRRILPDVRFSRIFPLDGKLNVLAHALDPVNQKLLPNSIYLLDKDFDDILGKKISDKRIFYWDRYCVENYLIETGALVEVVVESQPRLKREGVGENLFAKISCEDFILEFFPLFRLFFAVQLFDLGLKNCDCAPETYCSQVKLWKLDAARVAQYRLQVIDAALEKNILPKLLDPESDVRIAEKVIPAHSVVSGKFLLAAMFHYIKSKYKMGNITFESFAYRVAKNSEFVSMTAVAEKIRSHLKL